MSDRPDLLGLDEMPARIARLPVDHRGSARARRCAECSSPAEQWAYDHSDPDERISAAGLPYSTDLDHYRPLCKSCHVRLDQQDRARTPDGRFA